MFVRPQNEKRQIKPTTPCKGVVSVKWDMVYTLSEHMVYKYSKP